MTLIDPAPPVLTAGLQERARRYVAARRRSGEALLEAVAELASARAEAQHGEWLIFVAAIGLSANAAQAQLRLHEEAQVNSAFAEYIRSGRLALSAADELLAASPEVRQQLLTSGEERITRTTIRAAKAAPNDPPAGHLAGGSNGTAAAHTPLAGHLNGGGTGRAVATAPSPHLQRLMSSKSAEWYTPPEIVAAVLRLWDDEAVDLDPCSPTHDAATAPVPARRYYTRAEDGLAQPWAGRVYVNPPYGRAVGAWVVRTLTAYTSGEIEEAIVLIASRTDTTWMQPLHAYPRCFIAGRLRFYGPDADGDPAMFPSAIVYLGNDLASFRHAFEPLGTIAVHPDAPTPPAIDDAAPPAVAVEELDRIQVPTPPTAPDSGAIPPALPADIAAQIDALGLVVTWCDDGEEIGWLVSWPGEEIDDLAALSPEVIREWLRGEGLWQAVPIRSLASWHWEREAGLWRLVSADQATEWHTRPAGAAYEALACLDAPADATPAPVPAPEPRADELPAVPSIVALIDRVRSGGVLDHTSLAAALPHVPPTWRGIVLVAVQVVVGRIDSGFHADAGARFAAAWAYTQQRRPDDAQLALRYYDDFPSLDALARRILAAYAQVADADQADALGTAPHPDPFWQQGAAAQLTEAQAAIAAGERRTALTATLGTLILLLAEEEGAQLFEECRAVVAGSADGDAWPTFAGAARAIARAVGR